MDTRMDCKKAHSKCKAQCCSCTTPLPTELWKRNQEHMKRSYEVMEYGELFGETHDLLLTEDRRCVFLNDDLSCNVYEDRPWVCKKYGDESCSFMTCPFQSKEGRMRSRQDRRKIERENLSDFKKINKLALLEEKKHS